MSERWHSLRAIYDPQSIAIVGASDNKLKFGGRPIHYMQKIGYAGRIYPINPRSATVQGLEAYPDLASVGAQIDLALIAVPAAAVLDAARQSAAAGVKVAVIIASGFSEADAGGDGERWQQELTALARESGTRFLGPNCMGSAAVRTGAITTFATFYDIHEPRPGGIAIASQSGAVGGHTLVLASERGLGIHSMVTTGNECDIDVAECVAYAAEDPTVSVIAAYFEGCKQPELLRQALETARRNRKPVVALKVGASELGAYAAGTHTASLAGSDAAFDAVLKAHGAFRAHSLDELLEIAAACDAGRFPAGKRLGVVTVSGGGGVMAADAASEFGLELPALPESAQRTLKALMPFAAVRNPVDTTAQVSNDMQLLAKNLEVILDEGGCHAVMVFLTYVATNPRIWAQLKDMLVAFRGQYPDALVVMTGLYRTEDAAFLREHGYLVVEDLRTAVRAVAALAAFARSFEAAAGAEVMPSPPVVAALPASVTAFNEFSAARALAQAGVSMADGRVAADAEAAEAIAGELCADGRRIVVKLLSADIAHKSDIGGVVLGVDSPLAAADAFCKVTEAGRSAAPGAAIDGALLAPMVSGGVETILGVVVDEAFGPVVMFGLGGVFTEIFEDIALRIAPVSEAQALAMVHETRGFALLDGARGRARADQDALVKSIVALSDFAMANRERLLSVDVNPFVVLPEGEGALGLDAVIELKRSPD